MATPTKPALPNQLNPADAEIVITLARPLYDRVLVRQLDAPRQFGMIHAPDQAREKPNQGRIISVGDGHRRGDTDDCIPLRVKVGDLVLFGKYAGSEVVINQEKFLMMREEEILAVITGASDGPSKLKQ